MQLEDEVMRLKGICGGRVDACVVACGLLVGLGEDCLYDWFLEAWMQRPLKLHAAAPAAANVVPTLRARDLGAFLVALASLPWTPMAGNEALPPAGPSSVVIAGSLPAGSAELPAPGEKENAMQCFPRPYMVAVNEEHQVKYRNMQNRNDPANKLPEAYFCVFPTFPFIIPS